MQKLIIDAIRPILQGFLAKAKAGVPGAVDALVAWLTTVVPAAIDRLKAGFMTWLAGIGGPLKSGTVKLLDLIGTKVIAKL
jgi:mannose/fructose/N-acetylgalactosamine-specific phosphotransferase system component IID